MQGRKPRSLEEMPQATWAVVALVLALWAAYAVAAEQRIRAAAGQTVVVPTRLAESPGYTGRISLPIHYSRQYGIFMVTVLALAQLWPPHRLRHGHGVAPPLREPPRGGPPRPPPPQGPAAAPLRHPERRRGLGGGDRAAREPRPPEHERGHQQRPPRRARPSTSSACRST